MRCSPFASIFQQPPRRLVCVFLLYHGVKRNDIICHVFRFPAIAGEKNGTKISITAARRLLYHGVKRNDIICHIFRFPAIAGEKNGTKISITAARRLLYHGAKRNDIICHVFRFPAQPERKTALTPPGEGRQKGASAFYSKKRVPLLIAIRVWINPIQIDLCTADNTCLFPA